jgi:hypothetical protein
MQRRERNFKKGGSPLFPSELKDHRCKPSAAYKRYLRGGNFTHARQSDRSLVFLVLVFENQVPPPSCWQGSIAVTSCRTSGLQFGKHPLMMPEMILRPRCGDVNGLKSGARCLRPHICSFQRPFQSLQGCGGFVCPNHGLAILAVADAHQNGDVLEPLLDKREIMTELNCLIVGKRSDIF